MYLTRYKILNIKCSDIEIKDQAQNSFAGIMLLIWCSLDLIRFPFYALNTWKIAPVMMAELRYYAELFLYPVSLIAESKNNLWRSIYILYS